jgi:hypothetical protein
MLSKEFRVESNSHSTHDSSSNTIKNQIMGLLDASFSSGAILDIKIIDGVNISADGKRFSQIRIDIISNTAVEDLAMYVD